MFTLTPSYFKFISHQSPKPSSKFLHIPETCAGVGDGIMQLRFFFVALDSKLAFPQFMKNFTVYLDGTYIDI